MTIRRRCTFRRLALVAGLLVAAGCSRGDDVNLAEQRDVLTEAVAAAARAFEQSPPAIESTPCDEPVDRDRHKFQGGVNIDLPASRLDAALEAARAAWDELGLSTDVTTVDGAEPRLEGRDGPVTVSIVASPVFDGDQVRVRLGGATACG